MFRREADAAPARAGAGHKQRECRISGMVWWNTHPNANSHKKFESIYDLFVHNVFFESYAKFMDWKYNLFDTVDCKKFFGRLF